MTHEATAHAEHVGVVVFPGETGRGHIVHGCGTHTGNLVGGHRDADARTADTDPEIGITGRNRLADGGAKVGVIAALLGVGAHVGHLMAQAAKKLGQSLLQFESGVIGPHGNAHSPIVRASGPCGRAEALSTPIAPAPSG